MAEVEYWQETAQMYEQLIQKPKMTQKLLCKPPFRYIHDIFTATLEQTGYGNGLFDESELDGKAITEKEAKINWLMKLLQLTELVIGEQIDCKPTKIVAGHEPEKTNFFLQQMFRAATAGIDTTPHVMQLLGVAQEGEEGEGDDAQAQAEAQAAAEAEAQRQEQEAEEARKKKKANAERKRQQEEQDRVNQEEQERKQREDAERQEAKAAQRAAKEQAQREAEKAKNKHNIMQDGQDQQDDDDGDMMQQQQQPDSQFQMQEGGRHGALVEEARKLMADDDDVKGDAPRPDEDTGPKIKMGRIGKKKKKGANKGDADSAPSENYTKQMKGLQAVQAANPSGGFNENDIEFMKKAIQVLCQSTNPLGKSIDYVTDDVDSMSKEFEHWRKEAISCTQALDEQRKITEELIHPLQDTLAELEERIREQVSKVTSIRSQILRNDITITNLLYSVIQSRE